MTRPRRAKPCLTCGLIASLAASAGGCGLELPEGLAPDANQLAEDAIDGADTAVIAVTLAALPSVPLLGQALTLEEAVTRQSELGTSFGSAACFTVESAGNTVTYVFDECTGPWGKVKVSGREVLTFSPGPTDASFQIDFASEELSVNGKEATHQGTAVVTLLSDRRRIEFAGSYEGEALLGARNVSHDAEFELEIEDAGPIRLSGSSTTSVGVRSLELVLDDLERPGVQGTCPTGTITAKRKLANLTITLSFDGTDEVEAESSRGGHDTFALECTPAGS